jgi:hypothetical protein
VTIKNTTKPVIAPVISPPDFAIRAAINPPANVPIAKNTTVIMLISSAGSKPEVITTADKMHIIIIAIVKAMSTPKITAFAVSLLFSIKIPPNISVSVSTLYSGS